MKYIFFTDIDGTILHSAKRGRKGDVPAEYKDGTLINLWTEYAAAILPEIKNIVPVVPVTTRSMEQYKRIVFPGGISPRFAITANGGGLLLDGVPDKEWAAWAEGITKECARELSQKKLLLESDPCRNFEIRMVDGLFLFTKSTDPEKTLRRLGTNALTEGFYTGQKVYVLPKTLNKGAAAVRFMERSDFSRAECLVICSGDSPMDIPMLNIADIAVCPDDIADRVTAPKKLSCPRDGFLDFVFNALNEILPDLS